MNWLRYHFILLCFFLGGLRLHGLFLLYTVLFRLGMTLWSSERLGRHSDFLCFKSSSLLFLSGLMELH